MKSVRDEILVLEQLIGYYRFLMKPVYDNKLVYISDN